jgi:peptide/nickel transport system ATP-binding protein
LCASEYDGDVRSLLDLHGVTVALPTAQGWVRPVNDVSLRIAPGESLGLVGESGSGKTMLSLTLMGLLPRGARVSGEALLSAARAAPKDLAKLQEDDWRAVRGREIAMVFQEPMTSLNPVMRVGAQIEEAIRAHEAKLIGSHLQRRVHAALERAAVPEPDVRAGQFPHQLSGGLRQRIMIAMALAANPQLLIADEPTTALDVTIQAQVLDLIRSLKKKTNASIVLISHDLGVIAEICDEVAVMYAGEIVEHAPVDTLFRAPQHPYTIGLLASIPRLDRRVETLATIEGSLPDMSEIPLGCRFAPRCPFASDICVSSAPPIVDVGSKHWSRCVKAPLEEVRA